MVKASEGVLEYWLREYIDIVFANEDEASAYFPGMGRNYEEMAAAFAELCDVAAIKMGKEGSMVSRVRSSSFQ